MIEFGSVHPHLLSPTNSRFSAVLERPLGDGSRGLYRSTRFPLAGGSGAPRRTEKQNILRRVHVPVVGHPTIRTGPYSDLQRHFRLHRAARATGLAAGRPAVYHHNIPAVPLGLVFNLPAQLRQPAISNRLAQTAVSQHALDIQILQADHLVFVHQLGGGLVQKIPAAIGNPDMNTGNPLLLFLVAIRSPAFPFQPPLGQLQPAGIAVGVLGRAGLKAVGSHHDILNPYIHANAIQAWRQRLNLDFTAERHEVPAARIPADRHHLGRTLDGPRPAQLERPELREFQQPAFGVKSPSDVPLVQLVANRLRTLLLFELGILSAVLEEVLKGLVLVQKGLGQYGAIGVLKPRVVRVLLQFGDGLAQRNVILGASQGAIGQAPGIQGRIPDPARTTEVNSKLLPLGSIGIKPESVSSNNHLWIIPTPKREFHGETRYYNAAGRASRRASLRWRRSNGLNRRGRRASLHSFNVTVMD